MSKLNSPDTTSFLPAAGGADVTSKTADQPKRPAILIPSLFGTLIVIGFFVGFIGWSATAKLESAAVAIGKVVVESNRRTVEHLEGGIVSELLVSEGRDVEQGDALIILDRTRVQARLDLLNGQLAATERQLELFNQRIAAKEKLLAEGWSSEVELISLQVEAVELEGTISELKAQLLDAQDAFERTIIRAPIGGTIVGLRIHSNQEVVDAGEPLMDIVPSDEPLIVEASVDPIDSEVVRAGLDALVHLTPYGQRNVRPVMGMVLSVSADVMIDERSGQSYFLARVELMEDPADVVPGAILYAGMPVEVMIVTGESTLLDFFIQPVRRAFDRALREN
jgi:multidrug efflux pump subunit AcrA (membrane-fusion protein)